MSEDVYDYPHDYKGRAEPASSLRTTATKITAPRIVTQEVQVGVTLTLTQKDADQLRTVIGKLEGGPLDKVYTALLAVTERDEDFAAQITGCVL